MSGQQQTTCGCGKPLRDNAMLCHKCTGRLRRDIGDIGGLAAEIETTRLRQSRTGGQAIGGGHSSDRPLPYDDRPVLAARRLREVCRQWAGFVVEHRGVPWPRDLLGDYGVFLLEQVGWLRQREEAPVVFTELTGAIGRVRGSIDRRAERVYAGPCGSVEYDDATGEPDPTSIPCPGDVYGRPWAKTATCQTCGAEHDTADRRQWLLAAVEDQLAHIALLSKALSNLGRPIADPTIRSWERRGRLLAHGEDLHGRALYRVGDVLDLIAADAERQAESAARKRRAS